MEGRPEQCLVCGEECQAEGANHALCSDCEDTWQREAEATW